MQELYIPRRKYIEPIEKIGNCPDCDELLVAEKSMIVLYGKSDVDEGEFITNVSGSHFCPNCPVVVFEKETIERAVESSLRMDKWFNYSIMGLVDLEAVPEEKRDLELGAEGNPIPLVDFIPNPSIEKYRSSRHAQNPFGRKVGRNEPCPCGSGKKYKKCCL